MNNKDPFDVQAEEPSVTSNIIKKIRSGQYQVGEESRVVDSNMCITYINLCLLENCIDI